MTLTNGGSTYRERASLIAFLAVLAVALGLGYSMVAPYVISIVMGGILAMLVYPLYLYVREHWSMRPNVAALLVTGAVVILVVAPILALSGLAIKQAMNLVDWVRDAPGLTVHELLERMQSWKPVAAVVGDAAELRQRLGGLAQNLGRSITGALLKVAAEIPNIVLQLFIACLACYFFLVDGRRFTGWMGERLPLDADIRTRLNSTFKDTAVSVIWASMAAAAAQALMMLLAFAVLDVPAAALAGGATFVFAWIPILGSTPVWLSGMLYLYLHGSILQTIAMLACGIVTSLLDNFIRPLVLKGRSEMHPLVSLVAIFGGIQMLGIVGVLCGPIVAAIVITLLQVWPAVGRRCGIDFVD